MTKDKNWLIDFAERWAKYWEPPARPTAARLAFVKGHIEKAFAEKGDAFSLLILGSTSEFRDVCIDLGIHPTIVDFSKDNYDILSSAMKHKDNYAEKETFIQDDWRTMDLGKEFDLIITDAAFNIVTHTDNEVYLQNIAKHMHGDSLFIDTCWGIPKKYEYLTLREEVTKRKEDLEKHSFYKVFSPMVYASTPRNESHVLAIKNCATLVEQLYDDGLITEKQIEPFRLLGKDKTQFEFFYPPEEFVEKRLEQFFIIEEKWIDQEYVPFYSECYPTYVLKKK